MKLRMTLVCGFLLSSSGALAQDQAQQNLRQQQQQEQNWQWHQMEQEAAQQQEMHPPPPQPTGEWIKTWGAIADGTNGQGGVAVGQLSKGAAEREAVGQCTRSGGMDCKPTYTYFNQCVALASPVARAKAGSKGLAEDLARDACNERNSAGTCRIVYSACSDPVFQHY